MKNQEYFVNKISNTQYDIAKFLNGEFNTKYIVLIGKASLTCNCISGHIRGYCKHKDWIRDIIDGNMYMLPNYVKLVEQIKPQDLEVLVNEVESEVAYSL